jgi:hypothetical protein
MTKEDVMVWVEDKMLVVKAEKVLEKIEGQDNGEKEEWYAKNYGRYSFRIALPVQWLRRLVQWFARVAKAWKIIYLQPTLRNYGKHEKVAFVYVFSVVTKDGFLRLFLLACSLQGKIPITGVLARPFIFNFQVFFFFFIY